VSDAASTAPADLIRRTLNAVVLQAGCVSVADAHEALDALVDDLHETARKFTLVEAEADRAWAVLDWLAENNPAALELCPYKAKR
jgi:hypothetical protein